MRPIGCDIPGCLIISEHHHGVIMGPFSLLRPDSDFADLKAQAERYGDLARAEFKKNKLEDEDYRMQSSW
jgi:hypothetical protein